MPPRRHPAQIPAGPCWIAAKRYAVTKHVMRLPQLFMDTADLSAITNVLQIDMQLIINATSATFTGARAVFMFCFTFALLFKTEPQMAFVLMGMVPLNLWVAIEGANRIGIKAMDLRAAERRFMQFAEEARADGIARLDGACFVESCGTGSD